MSFKKRLRNLLGFRASIAALLVGASAVMGAATPAFAERGEYQQQERVDAFTPGHWHRLGSPNDPERPSLAALMRVEAQTGAVFCKRKDHNGNWYSNLIDCGNRGVDTDGVDFAASPGVLIPAGDSFLDRMFEYQMSATRHDRGFTQALRDAQQFVVARVTTPRRETVEVAERAPVIVNPVLPQQGKIEVAELPPIEPVARIATVVPERRVVPAYVLARLSAERAELGDAPTAESNGRFVRRGDIYERRLSADGQTAYDFRYDPYTNGYQMAYRVFTRANGTEGYSANIGDVQTATLVAFARPAVAPTVLVAEAAADRAEPHPVERVVAEQPVLAFNGSTTALINPPIELTPVRADVASLFSRVPTGGELSRFTPGRWSQDSLRDLMARASRFVPRAAPVEVAAVVAFNDTPAEPQREKAANEGDKYAIVPSRPGFSPRKAFEIVAADVTRKLPGMPEEQHFVRVKTEDNEIVDIAKHWKRSNGDYVAFAVTKVPGRERYTSFDLAQNPVLREAPRLVA